jgi:hypothetical protein
MMMTTHTDTPERDSAQAFNGGSAPLRYSQLKSLAAELSRPASTLVALSPANDPFSITPGRRDGAQWFARIWKRLNLGSDVHLRRLHYAIVSQAKPLKMPNGTPYENTLEAWQALIRTSNDARYLDLVPAQDFVDRRNDEPLIYLSDECNEASLGTIYSEPHVEITSAQIPALPTLHLTRPVIQQPYHVEVWCEKTSVNDVLEKVAVAYGCNIVTGAGELSQTACVNLVQRAEESGRPVRILYISDFDPAGQSMPVAVARKIEHRLHLKQLDLDIQVRPIALTAEQCREYRLPRTPIKETERRAERFEARFGEGATELDALEALRSGELRKIIEGEIERYFDVDLDDAVNDTATEIEDSITKITRSVHAKHRTKIKTLEAGWRQIAKEHARQIAAWRKRAKVVWHAVANDLRAQAPDPDEINWPEPADGYEDDDPLFDSTRDYVEQIDRYKAHQGKPTERRSGRMEAE